MQFHALKTSEGGTVADNLTRDAFRHNFKHILPKQYIDKVFEALDLDHDGKINFREFVMVTHILSGGSDEEKIDYLFNLYDKDNKGKLTPVEVAELVSSSARGLNELSKAFGEGPAAIDTSSWASQDVVVKQMTERFLQQADRDHDGFISLSEFRAYCKSHPILLADISNLRTSLQRALLRMPAPGPPSPNVNDSESLDVALNRKLHVRKV